MQSYHYELYEINLPILDKKVKQAGAELGQAQLKLGFDFTLFFWKSSPRMEKKSSNGPPFGSFSREK